MKQIIFYIEFHIGAKRAQKAQSTHKYVEYLLEKIGNAALHLKDQDTFWDSCGKGPRAQGLSQC